MAVIGVRTAVSCGCCHSAACVCPATRIRALFTSKPRPTACGSALQALPSLPNASCPCGASPGAGRSHLADSHCGSKQPAGSNRIQGIQTAHSGHAGMRIRGTSRRGFRTPDASKAPSDRPPAARCRQRVHTICVSGIRGKRRTQRNPQQPHPLKTPRPVEPPSCASVADLRRAPVPKGAFGYPSRPDRAMQPANRFFRRTGRQPHPFAPPLRHPMESTRPGAARLPLGHAARGADAPPSGRFVLPGRGPRPATTSEAPKRPVWATRTCR